MADRRQLKEVSDNGKSTCNNWRQLIAAIEPDRPKNEDAESQEETSAGINVKTQCHLKEMLILSTVISPDVSAFKNLGSRWDPHTPPTTVTIENPVTLTGPVGTLRPNT